MKYVCEICGAAFGTAAECSEHERGCREHHAKALFIQGECTECLNVARYQNIQFGVEARLQIELKSEGKPEQREEELFFAFDADVAAIYQSDKNRVVLTAKKENLLTITAKKAESVTLSISRIEGNETTSETAAKGGRRKQ